MAALSAHDDEDRRRMVLLAFAFVLVPVVLLAAFFGLRWAVHHHPVAVGALGLVLMSLGVLGLVWWYAR